MKFFYDPNLPLFFFLSSKILGYFISLFLSHVCGICSKHKKWWGGIGLWLHPATTILTFSTPLPWKPYQLVIYAVIPWGFSWALHERLSPNMFFWKYWIYFNHLYDCLYVYMIVYPLGKKKRRLFQVPSTVAFKSTPYHDSIAKRVTL